MYLKGIQLEELKAILDFVYNGVVTVAQEMLNNFLAVAEELAIKGISNDSKPYATDTLRKRALAAKRKYVPPPSSGTPKAVKIPKTSDHDESQNSIEQNPETVNIKAEPTPSWSENDLGDESYGTDKDV